MTKSAESENQVYRDPTRVTAALNRMYAVESSELRRAELYAQFASLEETEADDDLINIK